MSMITGSMDAPAASSSATKRWTAARLVRLAVGIALAMLALLPFYSQLAVPETGLAGAATRDMAGAAASVMWSSLLLLLIPVILLTRTMPEARLAGACGAVHRLLDAPRTSRIALVTAGLAIAVTTTFSFFVLRGQPNLVDAMSQLVHARYFAAGRLTGPQADAGAAWTLQQSLFGPAGWASQYPPGHAMLLALGIRIGAPWIIGPVMLAIAAVFTLLAAERLLPGRRAEARLAALLVAVSPFMVAHAGAYMSHTSAAAFAAIAIWCSVRSDEAGGSGAMWALVVGLAVGAAFATRPLSGIVIGIVTAAWLATAASFGRGIRRAVLVAVGAAPFIALIGLYNRAVFGSALRFGYSAALGPAGGLGFGIDPWGNTYGPAQAIAYTSAELTTLNTFLLETPVPVVAIVALWLILAPRIERGASLLLGWAIAPVAALLAYWHHGLFMGPRMLNESAPAWIVLAVVAASSLVRMAPLRLDGMPAWSPRSAIGLLFTGALVAAFALFAPMRLTTYAQRPLAFEAASGADAPALIFVHGGWTSRLAMRLAAGGMRLDSVEAALRQNPTCAVERWLDDGSAAAKLDFERRATLLPTSVEVSPGNRIRVGPGERTLSGECGRQAAADRFGVLDVSPLLWRGDLQGLNGSGRMFVRDLGPDGNRSMLAAYPDRTAYVLLPASADGPPRLVAYDAAMKLLWGEGGA